MKARHKHIPGTMNRLEARYAEKLNELQMVGGIRSWRFEPMKLRLADRTFYEPDFWVVGNDDSVAIHEVKGFWEDDARVKIKVAAEMFHEFEFFGVTWSKKDGWKLEPF